MCSLFSLSLLTPKIQKKAQELLMLLPVWDGSVCEAATFILTNEITESTEAQMICLCQKHSWRKGRRETACMCPLFSPHKTEKACPLPPSSIAHKQI